MGRAYSLLDLFAGVGGVSLAFKNTFKDEIAVKMSNDIDTKCSITFNANNEIEMVVDDMRNVRLDDFPNVTIVTAGFNCQPFSIAGERKGFDDIRSEPIEYLFQIIDHIKPVCVFLENVKGLLAHDEGKSMEKIISRLQQCGLRNIQHKVIDSAKVTGIPQHRERIYIVAFRHLYSKKAKEIFENLFDLPEVPIQPWRSVLDHRVEDKYYYTETSFIYPKLANIGLQSIYQYRRGVLRENKSGVFPTLVATMGTGGHNVPIIRDDKGIRKITPRECFRLQGFPDTYELPCSDSHLYKQIGNSVSS